MQYAGKVSEELANFTCDARTLNRVRIQRSLYERGIKQCFSGERGTPMGFKSYCSQGYVFKMFIKQITEDPNP